MRTMIGVIRRLGLGLFLLVVAGGVLLYTDRPAKPSPGPKGSGRPAIRMAVVQHASLEVLDQGLQGILDALESRGYADGDRLAIRRFNAQGDIGTANAIAREVTRGDFDILVSVSTVSLQTVANANRAGSRTPHVFGLVSDPYAAGVGIDATNHLLHPPHLAGAGSMQPVEEIFRTARKMRPELKSVGLVWNAAEVNSMVQTRRARKVCAELGIDLVEGNAENSSAVLEAVNSVIARGAECLFISGDVTVITASEQVLAVARRARLPVFTALPPTVQRGALFDLGANYHAIGSRVGGIAADVLDGKDPASMPVDDYVPLTFLYNEKALAGLRDRWSVPADLARTADGRITDAGTNIALPKVPAKGAAPRAQSGRMYSVGLAYFAPEDGVETCIRGVLDGLRVLGFEEGRNLVVRRTHAQAEIANIPALVQNLDSSDVDVILPMSTPVISAACNLARKKPVVFTYCSDPVAAGAGVDFTNHLPHVTGIGSFPPVGDMVEAIRRTLPEARSVGTLYNASEANSVKVVGVARDLFSKSGIKLEEVTVASPAEVFPAAQALGARKVDAVYIQGDNTVIQGFDAVIKATRDARLPLFVDDPVTARRGAVACVGLGFYQPGVAVAPILARVLRGESPAGIPIRNVSEKTVWLDSAAASGLGVAFPPDLVAEAAKPAVAGFAPPAVPSPGRRARIDLVEYLETPNVEINREGLREGLAKAGWQEGRNLELRVRNAQGDMATLNTILDATSSDAPDLLVVSTTPALQAALQRAGRRPMVFSLVANPVVAGAGRSDTDHLPNVTGAYVSAPHAEGLSALRRCLPGIRRIGTLYAPAEVNSVFYKDELLKAARGLGIEVELVGVGSSGEVADAALALCSRGIQAVCQVSDNLTGASFASIVQAARRARLPLMGFATGQARAGAFLTVSRDFHDGGVASAAIAARVLGGESPAVIPFQPVERIKYVFNPAAAAAAGVVVPPDLLQLGESIH